MSADLPPFTNQIPGATCDRITIRGDGLYTSDGDDIGLDPATALNLASLLLQYRTHPATLERWKGK